VSERAGPQAAANEARPPHDGKLVIVIIEDTCYRILHDEEERAVKAGPG
jgi:hypothetical protein